ncbi:MAG: NAD-binding protein [Gammaproteobacteria bacterium]|nr:NAD-binding protein [Gammaproteobacteria bacterium]NIM72258.1 NAD-binding protein [Gammaproteobacteria bacterium]NIN39173.1 NAD-binding protein [Gammaproteobacteria bacterium]NIO24006.1 NAD-binding protein [Gammaproteobacteria bacterium]NIO64658.1 NAD-binding protein [Gammaproteobacteria bacterium]
MDKIGFIGLGRMGRPMAGNMQRKGFSLMVYDIAEAPVQALVELGAVAAGSVAELAGECRTVITVLPSHVEVEDVLLGGGGIVSAAESGTLVMDMSTVDPASTDRMAAALADAGMRFVDAPIGRLASHADRGECLFMVGADDADFDQVRPMLDAMGTDIHHCGPPGSGIRTKLVNNYLAITSCQMNAEALALTQRFGLDVEKTLNVIHGTTATNGQLKVNYASKVLAGDTEPGFQIDLAHKDLSLVMSAANAGRVPMTIGAAARESLSMARARGWGGKDFSALLDALCESAGLDKVRLG